MRSALFTALLIIVTLSCVPNGTEAKKKVSYLLNKPQCNTKALKKIELLVARIVSLGPHGRPFPENYDELAKFCRETTRMVAQVEAFFKDCYTAQVRQMSNILIFSVKNNIKKYCHKKRAKVVADLLSVSKCANDHIRLQIPCLDQFINSTKQLIGLENDELKIPHTCCNGVASVRCGEQYLDRVPCVGGKREVIMDFVRGLYSNLVQVGCGEYNEATDACDRLGPPPRSKLKNKSTYVSFTFVIIDLLESIKEFSAPV